MKFTNWPPVIHAAPPHGEPGVEVIAGQAGDETCAVLDTLITEIL